MNIKDRERDIVKMLSEGKKPAEIGSKLNLAKRTIESYIDRIKDSHMAENSPHLVGIFFRKKLIE